MNRNCALTLSNRLMPITLLFCMAAIVLVPQAFADSTYTYQGPNFTTFDGTDKCVLGVGTCAITASITLSSALGDNFTGQVSPIAVSISDGQNVLTNNGVGVGVIETFFVTNSAGKITDWLVDLNISQNIELFTGVGRFGIGFGNCQVEANDGTFGNAAGVFSCAQTPFGGPVGVWALQPTAASEPSSTLLLGIGLLALIGLTVKKTVAA